MGCIRKWILATALLYPWHLIKFKSATAWNHSLYHEQSHAGLGSLLLSDPQAFLRSNDFYECSLNTAVERCLLVYG